MENPSTWGEAERIVSDVLYESARHQAAVRLGTEEPIIGLSIARQITDALRKAGLLLRPPPACPDKYIDVLVPLTLKPNWDQPEAEWWRRGVAAAREM